MEGHGKCTTCYGHYFGTTLIHGSATLERERQKGFFFSARRQASSSSEETLLSACPCSSNRYQCVPTGIPLLVL